MSNVLSYVAVAACRSAHKHTVRVGQCYRKPVYLRLYRPLGSDICLSQLRLGAPEIFFQLLKGENIGKGIKRDPVRDLFKSLKRSAPDALSRGFRVKKLRVRRLKLLKTAIEHIIIVIGYLRRIVNIIFTRVVCHLSAQCFKLAANIGGIFFTTHAVPRSNSTLQYIIPYFRLKSN